MVRTALIGAGTMGKGYLRRVGQGKTPTMQITAVVARRAETQQEVREICGDSVQIFKDEDELYAHSDLFDAVLVVTPHRFHPAMGMNALKHGKHLLLDKPVAVSVADCGELIQTAKESGLVFSVVFHQRAYPKYQKIRAMIQNGEIGELNRILLENNRYFRTPYYHHSGSWRSSWNGEGGGALINQGQHILDIWQWLFGMPEELYAQIGFGKYNDFQVDDEAILTMRYADGKTGTFILSTGEGTYTEKLEIIGSKGTILLEEDHLTVTRFDKDLREYRKTAQVNSREELHSEVSEENLCTDESCQHEILENFARAIAYGEPLLVEGEDAVNALELTNAAYLSAWNHMPVKLPVDADEYQRQLEAHKAAEGK